MKTKDRKVTIERCEEASPDRPHRLEIGEIIVYISEKELKGLRIACEEKYVMDIVKALTDDNWEPQDEGC